MAKDRISFDKHDAQLIRALTNSQTADGKKGEDYARISDKIKGYLDIQNGKAPSKLERMAENAKAKKAPKAKAKPAPKAKAPAKPKAKAKSAPKAKPAKAKAPAKDAAPFKMPQAPKRFDEE